MPTRQKSPLSKQLNAARMAIANTLADEEIQRMVAASGYSLEKLIVGNALYEAALSSVNAQIAAVGAQYQATAHVHMAKLKAQDAYQALAKVSRAVFVRDRAQLAALGLIGPMPRATAAVILAGYTIFNNALKVPEILSALRDYGFDEAGLQQERTKIAAFDGANQAQESAKGAAQQATIVQNEALAAMNAWVAHYIKIAKVALREKPQLLEKIGVLSRSLKTAGQRGAPKKASQTRMAKKIVANIPQSPPQSPSAGE
jgi:hypothetical protein